MQACVLLKSVTLFVSSLDASALCSSLTLSIISLIDGEETENKQKGEAKQSFKTTKIKVIRVKVSAEMEKKNN